MYNNKQLAPLNFVDKTHNPDIVIIIFIIL